jgi:hypothetical protein
MLDAIGELPPAEKEELRAHLAAGCPVCAGSAAEARAIAAALPLALDVSEVPSPAVFESLVRRIHQEYAEPNRLRLAPVARRSRFIPAAIAASLAALITGGVMWQWLGETHRLVTTPDLQFVSLAGAAPQPTAHGRVFWDKTHPSWHVYFFDLKPPPIGKEYELWFITAKGEKLAAGTFGVDAQGNAQLVAQLPPNIGPLAAAAVTDERLGGVSAPQGSIQLLGKIE